MLTVTALISESVKAAHAAQKLRARGVPPEAIRTIARDPEAAAAIAAQGAGDRLTGALVGALLGLLLGGALGWMVGGSVNPLAEPSGNALSGPGPTALVGLAVGLLAGLLVGWLAGTLGRRGRIATYVESVRAGDTLLVADVAEDQLREVEALLQSYGARAIRALPQAPDLPAHSSPQQG